MSRSDRDGGDLFGQTFDRIALSSGAAILKGFALEESAALVAAIHEVAAVSAFRHLITPSGKRMSVAMTNCGSVGWATVGHRYQYTPADPMTGEPWPSMPELYYALATRAASAMGFHTFEPAVCLINRYEPGARLGMHQDRNVLHDSQPIVSVSLGVTATFRFGGQGRDVRPVDVPVRHGDVAVWGGPSRMNFHGILPLPEDVHPLTGRYRYNLTFRTARASLRN